VPVCRLSEQRTSIELRDWRGWAGDDQRILMGSSSKRVQELKQADLKEPGQVGLRLM
jgi:hypothetical protein